MYQTRFQFLGGRDSHQSITHHLPFNSSFFPLKDESSPKKKDDPPMAVDPLEGPSGPSVSGAERGCALWSQASGDVGLCEKWGGLILRHLWLVWDVWKWRRHQQNTFLGIKRNIFRDQTCSEKGKMRFWTKSNHQFISYFFPSSQILVGPEPLILWLKRLAMVDPTVVFIILLVPYIPTTDLPPRLHGWMAQEMTSRQAVWGSMKSI